MFIRANRGQKNFVFILRIKSSSIDLVRTNYLTCGSCIPVTIAESATHIPSCQYKTMTLTTDEFIRRFLLHVLPDGFHRIRHYGLFANKVRSKHLARARELLQIPPDLSDDSADNEHTTVCVYLCKSCGSPMLIIKTFYAAHAPRAPPIGQL